MAGAPAIVWSCFARVTVSQAGTDALVGMFPPSIVFEARFLKARRRLASRRWRSNDGSSRRCEGPRLHPDASIRLECGAGNARLQRELSVSYNRIGDVLVAQGNLTAALKSFRASLTIRERLAKADAGNAGWQSDLAVSFSRIGEVLVARGNLEEALKSFRASHDIIERLAKADVGNAGWQSDLAVSYNRIGDVFVAQGNLAAALKRFRASYDIVERLALSLRVGQTISRHADRDDLGGLGRRDVLGEEGNGRIGLADDLPGDMLQRAERQPEECRAVDRRPGDAIKDDRESNEPHALITGRRSSGSGGSGLLKPSHAQPRADRVPAGGKRARQGSRRPWSLPFRVGDAAVACRGPSAVPR